MDAKWKPIETAPIGPTLILGNQKTGDVFSGYGYWQDKIPRPLWASLNPDAIGRCKPTHWQEMPVMDSMERQ